MRPLTYTRLSLLILILVWVISLLLLLAAFVLLPDLQTAFQDSVGTGVLFAIITLFWGYICIAMGFGGYKLLQHFGKIKEDKKITSETTGLNSPEVQYR
jgi:hypothetical protein